MNKNILHNLPKHNLQYCVIAIKCPNKKQSWFWFYFLHSEVFGVRRLHARWNWGEVFFLWKSMRRLRWIAYNLTILIMNNLTIKSKALNNLFTHEKPCRQVSENSIRKLRGVKILWNVQTFWFINKNLCKYDMWFLLNLHKVQSVPKKMVHSDF